MSDALLGGESSGTPIETRSGSQDLAKLFQSMIGSGEILGGGGRMSSDAWMNMLGFDPNQAGLDDSITRALMPVGAQTSDLFQALMPIEQQQTNAQVSGLREMFGAVGGRFGRNAADAEATLRSELASGFAGNRANATLAASGQQQNFIANLLQSMNQSRSNSFTPLSIAAQFLQPGAPIIKEGMLPSLIGAGGNLAGLAILPGLLRPPVAGARA